MPDHSFRKFLLAALAVAATAAVSAQNPGGGGGSGFGAPGAYGTPGGYSAPGAYGAPGGAVGEAGYAPAPASRSATVTDPNRKLQPGDILSIKIEQDREPASSFSVRPTGEVIVEPLDHPVHVAGMTLSSAQSEIKRLLDKDYYYNSTVRLNLERVDPNTIIGRVYLSGAVNRPGEFLIPADRPMKLSDVITASGGLGKFADDRRVKLTRIVNNAPQVFTVDVKEILQKSRVDLDMDVKDGDRIVVKETFFQPR